MKLDINKMTLDELKELVMKLVHLSNAQMDNLDSLQKRVLELEFKVKELKK